MNKKHIIVLALVIGTLMGLVIGIFIRSFMPYAPVSVWGVSQVNLVKPGEARNGQYVGAVWRILADTMFMNFSAIKFNQTLVQNVNPSALPSGVSITSEISIQIWQTNEYLPYWEVPFRRINTNPITVVPKTFGVEEYYDWGYKYRPIYNKSISALQVDIYTLDWDNAQLHIPFLFKAVKNGIGPLVPNQFSKKIDDVTYLLDITTKQLVAGQNVTREIILTNPKDSSESMKIYLSFSIVETNYINPPHSREGFLTIQPPNGGQPVSLANSFIGQEGDVTSGVLFQILNGWHPETYSKWAYYWYWFGDSVSEDGVFKGNCIVSSGYSSGYSTYYHEFTRWGNDAEASGTTTGCVWRDWKVAWAELSEGWVLGGGDRVNVFDYPGWYHPFNESNSWSRLYPIQPQLYYSYPEVDDSYKEPTYGTKPGGLSLCDYIKAPSINVPQKADTNAKPPCSVFKSTSKPYLSAIRYLNPYDQNLYAGGVPGVCNFVAYMPLASCKWSVIIDITSELADAIIITENYLNVQIQNFALESDEVQPEDSVTLKMDLVNTLDIDGQVQLVLQVKEAIPFDSSGAGLIYFKSKEVKKNYQIVIYNKYANTIRDKITGHFTLGVWNGEKWTSKVNFTLTFLPGAGLPNTGISIRCVNKNKPSEGIESVSITVFWGSSKEKVARGITTKGGYAPITLDIPFEGKIDIIAVDNYGRFYTANKTDQYVSPTSKNEFTIEMIPIGGGGFGFDIMQYLPYIIGGSIGIIGLAVGAYAVKRRREVIY